MNGVIIPCGNMVKHTLTLSSAVSIPTTGYGIIADIGDFSPAIADYESVVSVQICAFGVPTGTFPTITLPVQTGKLYGIAYGGGVIPSGTQLVAWTNQ